MSHSSTGAGGTLTFSTSNGGEPSGQEASEQMRLGGFSGNLIINSLVDNTIDKLQVNGSATFVSSVTAADYKVTALNQTEQQPSLLA